MRAKYVEDWATAEGMIAEASITRKPYIPITKSSIPGARYTEPSIGSGAMTEVQARAAGHDVKVCRFLFSSNRSATILGHHEGFVNIVSHGTFCDILAVHIIGTRAYELIGEGLVAMKAEATVDTITNTIHAHSTL